jgi:hypothetical protein
MDAFITPSRLRRGLPSALDKTGVPVSKTAIIAIIQNIAFDEVFLPDNLVNDDPNNFTLFIQALGAALIETMISKSPRKPSPQK